MRRRASDYAAAAVFLVLFAIGGLVTTLLSPRESAALRLWASTNVASLHHHPVAALVLSAFLPSGSPLAWLAPIALTSQAGPVDRDLQGVDQRQVVLDHLPGDRRQRKRG